MATTAKTFKVDNSSLIEKISGRKSVYLDMNVWIDIAEERSSTSKRLKQILIDLVERGILFSPLSNSLIWELYKQGFASRLRVGNLMETLSLNACFAIREEIIRWEMGTFLDRTLNEITPSYDFDITRIYVPTMAYLTSYYSLTFPPEWEREQIEHFENLFSNAMKSLTLTNLIEQIGIKSSENFKSLDVSSYTRSTKSIWATTKGDQRKIWRLEEEGIANTYILPFINRLPEEVKAKLFAKLQKLPKDEYGGYMKHILESLPTMKNLVDVMVATTLDPKRKYKQQDFFDIESLAIPLAYATAFVSPDRWIRELLTKRSSLLKRNTCKYFSELASFESWLVSI